jgi:NAD(P)-dependent dehydrogenase (short-subunit alcohol dehydrogenase family)
VSRAIVNPMDLTGRSVLVTGGSSGIGQGTALRLSELGARVIVVGRNRERLDQTVAGLAGDGHLAVEFDLTRVEDIPDWLQRLAGETGPLDGLVHSAGVSLTKPLRSLSVKALRDILGINLEAAFMLARGFRRKGVVRGGGSIVLISSVAAVRGQPGLAAYAASKGGVLSMTRSLALELASDRIRVNSVVPAFIEGPMYDAHKQLVGDEGAGKAEAMYPLGRLGKPVDVANLIAFLLGDAAGWITGDSVVIDGGYLA